MSQAISSITSGPRKTNIEVLRILAMFLVLVVHADFWSLGNPTIEQLNNDFIPSLTRISIESISIVCVNVFVLISGWFTIKPSVKGFLNFAFQCCYFLFGIYIVLLLTGHAQFGLKGILGCFVLTSSNWFIRAYIGLYILAPLLNLYIEHTSKKQLGVTVLSFYIFQTIYGFIGPCEFVAHGYSTFSFIGLYLLAQYVKHYISIDYKWGAMIYSTSVIALTIAKLLQYRFPAPIDLYSYANPLVVIGALGLVIYFNGLKMKSSKFLNFIAKSSFAVFLLHTNPNVGEPIFKKICICLFNAYSGPQCLLMMFCFLTALFITAIILDIPRRYLWKWLSKSPRI